MDVKYDVMFSDGNDRYRIGVVTVTEHYDLWDDNVERAALQPRYPEDGPTAWDALDKAEREYLREGVEAEHPYSSPVAVVDGHDDDCECSCHDSDVGDDTYCGECGWTESIEVIEQDA